MKNQNNIQNFKQKNISIYIGLFFAGFSVTTTVLSAIPNELNIYKQPTQGKTNLLLMIDSTAGMDDEQANKPKRSIAKDYPQCANINLKSEDITSLDKKYMSDHTLKDDRGQIKPTFVYPMPYCDDGTSEYKYSRMDRMKVAMTKLLSTKEISDNINVGMGQFSAQTSKEYIISADRTANNNMTGSLVGVERFFYTKNDSYKGLGSGTGVSAKILLPTQPLDLTQRWKMRVAVNALDSGSSTPLASALAESGAYMLGKTTLNADGTSPGQESITGAYATNPSETRRSTTFGASGFKHSIESSKNGSAYKSPIQDDSASCNSNGVFLLTNAAPSQTQKDIAQQLMRNALGDQTFSCPANTGVIKAVGSDETDYGWNCMAEFAKRLKNSDKSIKVAVAGFGNNFAPYLAGDRSTLITDANGKQRRYYKCNDLEVGKSYTVNGITTEVTQDTINACNLGEKANSDKQFNTNGVVGGFGEGGFYPIISPDDLINSIKNFIADLETALPSMSSGIPGIPVDPLNATKPLPYAYYSQFQPNTTSSQSNGIWLGNIKKYKIANNTFEDKNSTPVINSTTGNLNSTNDFWSNAADKGDAIQGGALAQLPVQAEIGRRIYTNSMVTEGSNAEISTGGNNLILIPSNNSTATIGTAEALRKRTDSFEVNAYLLNLLGFGVSTPTVPSKLSDASQLRQMGATINSTPVMFTTKSKIATKSSEVKKGDITIKYNPGDYIDRSDYILFGTNQGLIQVLDADTGKEKFAFLPHEMIEKQKKGFIAKSLQTGSAYTELYQGMDAAWTVYATYEADSDSNSLKADNLNVYGGMRRGGSNYYALDLKDIETSQPKILFKVGPTKDGKCTNDKPLDCMGQSWSKPVVAWMKWKGQPQLVMIVGGGYDPKFDTPDYKADADATKGNGVYIFAANTNSETGLNAGDLMWWGSSTAVDTTPAQGNSTQKTKNSHLKYSVVSEIKTVDRDSDGFVDNFYFGDLGGQLFRVDIDNEASSNNANFNVKRIVRIGNFIEDSERKSKTAPKFYSTPTFTVHHLSGLKGTKNATRYAVISIGSGDQSSPTYNSLTTSTGVPDRVYGIFDRDLGRTDLFDISEDSSAENGLLTGTANVTNMLNIENTEGETAATLENMNKETTKGWYNSLSNKALGKTNDLDNEATSGVARFKVLSNFSSIRNTLFTSYFDAADNGSTASCSAGVKGRSYFKNYCLPFGNMTADGTNCGTSTDGRGFSTANTMGSDVGAGIVPVIVGGMTSGTSGASIGPITGMGKKSGVTADFKIPLRFEPTKWAEKTK